MLAKLIYMEFATGCLQPDGDLLNRSADVEVASNSALLVNDDVNEVIPNCLFETKNEKRTKYEILKKVTPNGIGVSIWVI